MLTTTRNRSKKKKVSKRIHQRHLLLLVPIIFLYGFFILGGIVNVFIESTGYIPALGLNKTSVSSYIDIIKGKEFIVSLLYSLYIAIVSASISTFLGVLLAFHIAVSKNTFMISLSKRVLQIGMILPYLYMVFLTMITFGKTGLISRILNQIGLIKTFNDFPRILYEPWGIGIILVYVLKGTPFVALFTMNIMSRLSNTYHMVAKTLGAKGYTTLRKVYLPITSNSIVWASTILFIYDLGSFEVPYLLGTNHYVTLSSKLYSLYISPQIDVIPRSMAMNSILLVIGSVSMVVYAFLLKKLLKREEV